MNKIQEIWNSDRTKDALAELREVSTLKFSRPEGIHIVRNYNGTVIFTARPVNTGFVVYYYENLFDNLLISLLYLMKNENKA